MDMSVRFLLRKVPHRISQILAAHGKASKQMITISSVQVASMPALKHRTCEKPADKALLEASSTEMMPFLSP